jgi:ankyrin repeat protein
MYLLAHTNKPEILKLVFNEYVELDHPLGVKPFYEIAFNEKAVDSHNMTECLIANMQMLLSEENQKALLDNRKLVALKDNLERVSKRLEVQKEPTDYGVNQKLIDSLEKDVLELTKKIEEIGEPKIVYDERINYQDENGNSPLLIACAMNNNRFAKFFLELGADINMENIMKETPIMHAIATDDVNLVKFLIEKGADVQRVNAENKSVLDFAKEIDNKEILEEVMRALDPTIEEGKISNRRAYRF